MCVSLTPFFVLDSHLATLWESNRPFGFLLVMFPLGSSYFVFVFLSLWCLWWEVWGNCTDSWSLPSFLFYLFPELKKLAGNKYETMAALLSAINRYLSSRSTSRCAEGMQKLPRRWQKCTDVGGKYLEKELKGIFGKKITIFEKEQKSGYFATAPRMFMHKYTVI